MRQIMNFARTCFLTAGVLTLVGCSGGVDDKLPKKFVPYSGTVTLDGKPLAGATVQFNPDASITKGAGAGGFGVTGTDGKFTLKYRGERDGVPPGTYKVTFSRLTRPDGSPIPASTSAAEAGGQESLPANYSDPEQSQSMVVIGEKGGTGEFPLESAKK